MDSYFKLLNRVRFLNEKKLEIKELTLQARKYLIDTKIQSSQEQTEIRTAANRMQHYIEQVLIRERTHLEKKFADTEYRRDVLCKRMKQEKNFDKCYEIFMEWVDETLGIYYYHEKYVRAVSFREEVMKFIPSPRSQTEVTTFLGTVPTDPLAEETLYDKDEVVSLSEFYNANEAGYKAKELEIDVKEELLKLYAVIGDIKAQLYATDQKREEIKFQIKFKFEEQLAESEKEFRRMRKYEMNRASDLRLKYPVDNLAFLACDAWHQYELGRKAEKRMLVHAMKDRWKKKSKKYWKEHLKTFKSSWLW